jgi:hypothetical protein
MFGGSASKIVANAKKGSSGPDVIPNSLNWNDPTASVLTATTTSQTITGIDTTITILIEVDAMQTDGSWSYSYSKNAGSYIGISNSSTFTVVNNDSLIFRAVASMYYGSGAQTVLIIKNQTNSNSTLDTITFALS